MIEHNLEVLKEEAVHLREAIGRAIRAIYTLFGVVLPLVLGAAVVLGKGEAQALQTEYLGFSVLAGVSVAFSYANTLWLEAIEYLRYMYVVLWPRMYELSGMKGQENFLHYSSRTRPSYSWLPAIIFQSTVLLGTLGISLALSWPAFEADKANIWLLLIGLIFYLGATVSSGIMFYSLYNLKKELNKTNPALDFEYMSSKGGDE